MKCTGCIFMAIWHFLNGRFHKHNICFWKFREKLQSLTKRKIILNTSNTHLVMKAVSVYMSIDEIMVVILFLFSH